MNPHVSRFGVTNPEHLGSYTTLVPEQDSTPPDGITVVSVNTDSDGEATTRGVLTSAMDTMIQIDALSRRAGAV
jgi:hypothetical protein